MTTPVPNFTGARRFPSVSLLLSAFAVLVWCSPELTGALEWRRDEPWQLWRWVTGHFCHWSGDHLTWDLVVFGLIGAMVERRDRRVLVLCLSASTLAITVAVALCSPHLTSYRGLSGIDCALLGCWLAALFSRARNENSRRVLILVLLIGVGFAAKLAIELLSGTTLFVDSQSTFVPVPLAHAVGFISGVAAAFATPLFTHARVRVTRRRQKPVCHSYARV